jgi:hypothetical protein
MSAVYTLIAISYGEIYALEVFVSFDQASKRAVEIGKALISNHLVLNDSWFDPEPADQKLPDGGLFWSFLDSKNHSVSLYFCQVNNPQPPNVKSKEKITLPEVILTDSTDPELPIGWREEWGYDGIYNVPAYVKDLEKYRNIITPSYLSDDEQWALVTARIKRRPKLTLPVFDNYGKLLITLNQQEILQQLKEKTVLGVKIKNAEIKFLESFMHDAVFN